MPVIIYGFYASPPVRAVLLTAKAIGLDVELKTVDIFQGGTQTEEFLKMNPAHAVPTMEDDGLYIGESRAIMTYLVQKYGKDDQLYPKDLRKRAVVDNMLYFDACDLSASFRFYYGPQILLGLPRNPGIEGHFKDMLGVLNVYLGRRPFAAGDHLTLADLSIAAALSMPEADDVDLSPFPNVTKWYEKIKQLPYFDEVSKKGVEELKAVFAAKLQKK